MLKSIISDSYTRTFKWKISLFIDCFNALRLMFLIIILQKPGKIITPDNYRKLDIFLYKLCYENRLIDKNFAICLLFTYTFVIYTRFLIADKVGLIYCDIIQDLKRLCGFISIKKRWKSEDYSASDVIKLESLYLSQTKLQFCPELEKTNIFNCFQQICKLEAFFTRHRRSMGKL